MVILHVKKISNSRKVLRSNHVYFINDQVVDLPTLRYSKTHQLCQSAKGLIARIDLSPIETVLVLHVALTNSGKCHS